MWQHAEEGTTPYSQDSELARDAWKEEENSNVNAFLESHPVIRYRGDCLMAENVPPSQAVAVGADQPGRPYYESLRASLRNTLEKKRKLDDQLASLEDQIFKTEGAYLEETSGAGNIVRGFDGWVKGVQVGGRGGDDRRRGRIRDEDRVFSRSSVGWMRAQEGSDSGPSSHAATPTGSVAPSLSGRDNNSKSHNKKKRPTEKDDDDDGKTTKRSKISYTRD
ncbi:NuA4-domain-containing protein [Polychaeton citri CBS 116435]|uniref:Chromatin modification-related protein EAF6 n=1 Tax=Polychaeton citri CBS 116435 TaxID=1314669 RepID=A0A9P4US39_9PEZI|nr:NuA4-domain-containing protein [Polychaeton citri CBS 116435]